MFPGFLGFPALSHQSPAERTLGEGAMITTTTDMSVGRNFYFCVNSQPFCDYLTIAIVEFVKSVIGL